MKNIILIILLFSIINLNAQSSWQEIISTKVPEDIRISSDLFQAAKLNEIDPKAALKKLPSSLYDSYNDKLILNIITSTDADIPVDRKYLEGLGIHVDHAFKNSAEVHISVNDLLDVASQLKAPYVLKSYITSISDNEGPGLTNASTYGAAGKTGQGVKVGIIDPSWNTLTNSINAGVAPAGATQYNYTPDTFESGTSPHGVGCLEMVFDYAQNAEYFLYKVNSDSDYALAVTDAIADGVDILLRSGSFFNQGWNDGSGVINAAVKTATDAGIIWLNGAGNFNGEHYQNTWFDNDGNNAYNFTNTDERVNFVIPQSNAGSALVALQWAGAPSAVNDYDIEIYNANTNLLIASGNSTNDFEALTLFNFTNNNIPAYAMIKKMGFLNTEFEFFIRAIPGNLEYFNDGSTVSPSNSLEDRAITVGVVNQTNYDQDNPPLEPFCSRGPTNGGRTVPELTTVDGCTAVSYPNGFFGASAGGPNVMGLMAAFWSEHTYLTQDELLEIIFKLASNYHDWGDPGMDNSYGHGGVYLPSYKPNSKFIYKALNNVNSDSDGPFISINQADDLVDPNSNLYFLGETFNISPVGTTVVDKPNVYRSAGKDTFIKQ